jgi:hypothetical protein
MALPETLRGQAFDDPYAASVHFDRSRERPIEGPDARGAMADDLIEVGETIAVATDGNVGVAE